MALYHRPRGDSIQSDKGSYPIGFIYEQPFSFESEAQQVLIQPVLVRHLPDEWYIRWGELNFVFNTETGDYNIPINDYH